MQSAVYLVRLFVISHDVRVLKFPNDINLRGLCDGPIPRPEGSDRMFVCVCVCVCVTERDQVQQ